jgi:photosystem II stability/assembly factor-like uncharacterized protein
MWLKIRSADHGLPSCRRPGPRLLLTLASVVSVLALGLAGVLPIAQTSAGAATPTWNQSEAYFSPIVPSAVACSTDDVCIIGGNGIIATSDGGSTWSYQHEASGTLGITSISCSNSQDCVAVGSATTPSCCSAPLILETTTAGATWSNVSLPSNDVTYYLTSVSCPTGTTDCIAAGADGSLQSTDRGLEWTYEPAPNSDVTLGYVSCASATACIGVGYSSAGGPLAGVAYSTTNLGQSWTSQTIPSGDDSLSSVSCPSASDCFASGSSGVIATANGGAKWNAQPGAGTGGILSCSSTSNCVVASATTISYTTDGGTAWNAGAVTVGSGTLRGVSCVASASDCTAVAFFENDYQNTEIQGEIFTSSNNGATWTSQSPPEGVGPLSSVACGTAKSCTAVGGTFVLHTKDSDASWSLENPPPSTYSLGAITCPSKKTCLATEQTQGGPEIAESSDGGSTWIAEPLPAGALSLTGITCWSVNDCIVVGQRDANASGKLRGLIDLTTNGGSSWAIEKIPGSVLSLSGVSCANSQLCIAVGKAQTTATTPAIALRSTSGGVGWSLTAVPSGTAALVGDSCSSAEICDAIGTDAMIGSSDGGSVWSTETVPAVSGQKLDLDAISCPAAQTCVVSGSSYVYPVSTGAIFSTQNGGTTWTPNATPGDISDLASLACFSASVCTAVGQGESGVGGVILVGPGA